MSVEFSSRFRLLSSSPLDAQLVRLTAAHAGLLDALTVVDNSKELQLIIADGSALRGSNTICRHIARSSAAGKALLGSDADAEALVCSSIP